MAYEVEPTSARWREIIEETNESKQGRMLRQYVYELESNVHSQESELKSLREENKRIKKDILSLSIVRRALIDAKIEAYKERDTDWNGIQEGV